MNNYRRKALGEAHIQLVELKTQIENFIQESLIRLKFGEEGEFRQRFDSIKADLEGIKDDEQEYFSNMPENMQQGERGSAAEQAVNELEEASCCIDNVLESMDELIEKLDALDGEIEEALPHIDEASSN